jgi:Flp pilus assembly protein TadG
MLRKLLRQARNNEEGNSLVLFLITFPIITLIFGFIVDMLLLNYARAAVQSAADSTAVAVASSIELQSFRSVNISDLYRKNIKNAEMVLQCKPTTSGGSNSCGANITAVTNALTKRVCVSVSEKVNFVFLDSLPFGLFGSAGDDLKKSVTGFADIKITNPGNSTVSSFKNKGIDYACAIIR